MLLQPANIDTHDDVSTHNDISLLLHFIHISHVEINKNMHQMSLQLRRNPSYQHRIKEKDFGIISPWSLKLDTATDVSYHHHYRQKLPGFILKKQMKKKNKPKNWNTKFHKNTHAQSLKVKIAINLCCISGAFATYVVLTKKTSLNE